MSNIQCCKSQYSNKILQIKLLMLHFLGIHSTDDKTLKLCQCLRTALRAVDRLETYKNREFVNIQFSLNTFRCSKYLTLQWKDPTQFFTIKIHCEKSVQVQSFFWSVFSCIQFANSKIRTRKNSVLRHFSRSDPLIDYLIGFKFANTIQNVFNCKLNTYFYKVLFMFLTIIFEISFNSVFVMFI